MSPNVLCILYLYANSKMILQRNPTLQNFRDFLKSTVHKLVTRALDGITCQSLIMRIENIFTSAQDPLLFTQNKYLLEGNSLRCKVRELCVSLASFTQGDRGIYFLCILLFILLHTLCLNFNFSSLLILVVKNTISQFGPACFNRCFLFMISYIIRPKVAHTDVTEARSLVCRADL